MNKMKYILMTMGLFFISQFNTQAQVPGAGRAGSGNMNMGHLYGKIVDAKQKAIDGATVQLKGSKFDPATKKSTEVILGTMLTANNGDFSFENLPIMGTNFKLVVSGLGFKKLEKQVGFNIKMGAGQNMQDMMAMVDKDLGNIKLDENPNELQTVTVASTAKPQSRR